MKSAKLSSLRALLQTAGLSALIVPSADPHNSEYVGMQHRRRAFLSNFHGSAGTCVVTAEEALLWTDGRYWLEAAAALSQDEWRLMRDGDTNVPTVEDWLAKHVAGPVGLYPYLATPQQWETYRKKFAVTACADFVGPMMEHDATVGGSVWPRPALYCGQTTQEKLALIANRCTTTDGAPSDAVVLLTALDDIAWFTNLRGADVPYNPVFYAYCLVDLAAKNATLFVDEAKLTEESKAALKASGVAVAPYDGLLRRDKPFAALQGRTVVFDENQSSFGLLEALRDVHQANVKRVPLGPATYLKALKNDAERNGFVECHVRDGAYLTKFLAWIDHRVAVEGARVTEVEAADQLEQFRKADRRFVQLSFETISGSGANGAIIHYGPKRESCAVIQKEALYLVDSGAQYLDGTTDVTRTVCFQEPTAEEREAYTLVLKGHIALNSCVWPQGTTGHRIDAFARDALWKQGLNYAHGTGHGVGSCLNVHEGPQGIHTRPTVTGTPLMEHMICSNEPGFYLSGKFGIRIENLEMIVRAVTKYNNGQYLTFQQLTMAPLCRPLIDPALLTAEEVRWVDAYHEKVRNAVLPLLQGDGCAEEYLRKHCAPLLGEGSPSPSQKRPREDDSN